MRHYDCRGVLHIDTQSESIPYLELLRDGEGTA